jgi:hypothetical protein
MGRLTAALTGGDSGHQEMRREDREEAGVGGTVRAAVGEGEGVGEGLPPLDESGVVERARARSIVPHLLVDRIRQSTLTHPQPLFEGLRCDGAHPPFTISVEMRTAGPVPRQSGRSRAPDRATSPPPRGRSPSLPAPPRAAAGMAMGFRGGQAQPVATQEHLQDAMCLVQRGHILLQGTREPADAHGQEQWQNRGLSSGRRGGRKGALPYTPNLSNFHAACAKNGESRSVPMNKVLTEPLRAVRMTRLASVGDARCGSSHWESSVGT